MLFLLIWLVLSSYYHNNLLINFRLTLNYQATTNHGYRAMLLASLSSYKFSVVRVSRREVGKLPYLLMRRIKVRKLIFEQITDAGLASLAAGCEGLTSVNLKLCGNITDAGLASLAAGCEDLTDVNLAGCEKITDAGLASLAAGCGGLTSVNLEFCGNITDAGLASLVAGCEGLTDVNLASCEKITDAGLASLAAACGGLINVNLEDRGYIHFLQRSQLRQEWQHNNR